MSKWLPEILIAVIILSIAGILIFFLFDPNRGSAIVDFLLQIHNEFIDSSVAT